MLVALTLHNQFKFKLKIYKQTHGTLKIFLTIILIGNKIDLNFEREISQNEGKAFAETYNLPFIETSAKTSENIKDRQ